jgi:hypothetical protein
MEGLGCPRLVKEEQPIFVGCSFDLYKRPAVKKLTSSIDSGCVAEGELKFHEGYEDISQWDDADT